MKKAFTLIELVFVVVVIGILVAVVLPRMETNPAVEASIQLESHIRYAQHLSMMDDKFDATDTVWHKNLWQVAFNGNQYSIVSDNNTRYAKDSLTQNDMNSIDLNDDFGVTVALSGGCSGETDISFDHLGRPVLGDLNTATSLYSGGLLTSICVITLTSGTETSTIHIEPESGYTRRI